MVHPQPVTAGHVLICPIRENVTSITQLTELETLEIFVCAKEIIKVFEDVFKVKNFMTLCQDGLYAKDFQSRAKQGEKCSGFCLQVLPQNEKLGT
jgi:diadenosine tetraphosphate (Ap4A) HIT family hydrolase